MSEKYTDDQLVEAFRKEMEKGLADPGDVALPRVQAISFQPFQHELQERQRIAQLEVYAKHEDPRVKEAAQHRLDIALEI